MKFLKNKLRDWLGVKDAPPVPLPDIEHTLLSTINKNLNEMVGNQQLNLDTLQKEIDMVLGAIALKNGGEYIIPNDFVQAYLHGDIKLEITKTEDNDIRLNLKQKVENG